MSEQLQPHTGNTRVSGRRFVAHWLDGTIFAAVLVLGFTVGQVAYYVLTQRRHGHTPGTKLVRIRVVDPHGGVPTTGALVKRTIPLLIEYFYVIAWIGMMTSPFRQRLGDRWADTYVIAE